MRILALVLLGLGLHAGPAQANWLSLGRKAGRTAVTAAPMTAASTTTHIAPLTATVTVPPRMPSARATRTAKAQAAKAEAAQARKLRLAQHEATVSELHESFENLHAMKKQARWWKALDAAVPVYEHAMAQAEAAIATAEDPTHAAQLRDVALVAYQVAKQTSQLRQGLWYSKPALLSGGELKRVEKLAAQLELAPRQLDDAYAAAMSAREEGPAPKAAISYKFGMPAGTNFNSVTNAMNAHSAVRTPMQASFNPLPATMEVTP